MSKKILITPKSFKNYQEKAYALIKSNGYEIIENVFGRTMTEPEILNYSQENLVGIIVGIDPLPASVLDRCPDLKAISKYGVGMDNIDLKHASELGIKVKNALGTNNISVAELAISMFFATARMIPRTVAKVKDGSWERVIGSELTGKKLGLIGGGQIGKEVAKRARGLEMEVMIFDPYFKNDTFLGKYGIALCDNLEELFGQADFVSLHVPATPETKGIINCRALQTMKKSAIVVNTSRGELVDEEALYEALVKGDIAAAAQDVFSTEPPQKGNKLLALDNFLLTSHIGAYTHEAIEKMVMISTQNLLEMLQLARRDER